MRGKEHALTSIEARVSIHIALWSSVFNLPNFFSQVTSQSQSVSVIGAGNGNTEAIIDMLVILLTAHKCDLTNG